jgi:hypothetical protein
MIHLINGWINVARTPLGVACWSLILGAPAAWLAYRVRTGRRPSAAEVARAEQMAATPDHPAGKAIPDPFDAEEWERRYAASQTADRRRKW